MSSEMGHRQVLSDLEGLWQVARWARVAFNGGVLQGSLEFLQERPDMHVQAESYCASFRFQEHVIDQSLHTAKTMVAIRFSAASHSPPDDPWTVYVRGDWPGRQDRLDWSGPWGHRASRALSPKRAKNSLPVALSTDIWLPPAVPLEQSVTTDVAAQLALFLLQAEVPSEPGKSQIGGWLADYLRTRLRLTEPDGEAIANAVFAGALRNYYWPPEATSWLTYIRRSAYHERRHHRATGARVPATLSSDYGQHSAPPRREPFDTSGRLVTVDEAAEVIARSRSTIYAWIKNGKIRTTVARGRLVIERSALDALKPRWVALVAVAMRYGWERAAARKFIYRRQKSGKTFAEIAGDVRQLGTTATRRRRRC